MTPEGQKQSYGGTAVSTIPCTPRIWVCKTQEACGVASGQNPPQGTTVSKTWGGFRRVGRSDGCVPQLPAQPGAGPGHSKAWAAARAASAWRMRRSLEGTWCHQRRARGSQVSKTLCTSPPPPPDPSTWPVLGELTTSHVRTRQGCVTVRLTFTVRINAPQEAGENQGKGSERNSVP